MLRGKNIDEGGRVVFGRGHYILGDIDKELLRNIAGRIAGAPIVYTLVNDKKGVDEDCCWGSGVGVGVGVGVGRGDDAGLGEEGGGLEGQGTVTMTMTTTRRGRSRSRSRSRRRVMGQRILGEGESARCKFVLLT